jgi:hypothetical protein
MQLLTVADVAYRLQISECAAREIVRKLQHVRVGKMFRLRPEVLDRYISKGGDQCAGVAVGKIESISKGMSTTPGEETQTVTSGLSPRTSEIRKRQLSQPAKSSGSVRLTPRLGHGRESRSKTR